MESATENSKSILKSGPSSEEKSMLLDDPEPKVNCKGGDPIIYDDAPSIYEPDLTQEDKFAASPTILLDKCNSSELKHQTATTPLEAKRVKVEDSKGKADDGGGNLLNHEKQYMNDDSPSHSPQKQAKENVAPEPELEILKEMSSEETEEISFYMAMEPTSRDLPDPIFEDHEVFIVKEGNGISDVRIHKLEAVCRHCSKLMSEDSDVLKAECECPNFSLVHRECPEQNMCSYCEQQIKCTSVSLSTVPPKEEYPKTRKRFGCFGFTK